MTVRMLRGKVNTEVTCCIVNTKRGSTINFRTNEVIHTLLRRVKMIVESYDIS